MNPSPARAVRRLRTGAQGKTLVAAAIAGLALTTWSVVAGGVGATRVWLANLALAAGCLAACLGLAAFAVARARATSPPRADSLSWTGTLACAYALVCAGTVLAVPLGERWDAWRKGPTLEWCERLVWRLRSFEDVHGHLPQRLDELGDPGPPWYALEVRYEPQAGEYMLRFGDFGFLGVDECTSGYDSRRNLWWTDDVTPSD